MKVSLLGESKADSDIVIEVAANQEESIDKESMLSTSEHNLQIPSFHEKEL